MAVGSTAASHHGLFNLTPKGHPSRMPDCDYDRNRPHPQELRDSQAVSSIGKQELSLPADRHSHLIPSRIRRCVFSAHNTSRQVTSGRDALEEPIDGRASRVYVRYAGNSPVPRATFRVRHKGARTEWRAKVLHVRRPPRSQPRCRESRTQRASDPNHQQRLSREKRSGSNSFPALERIDRGETISRARGSKNASPFTLQAAAIAHRQRDAADSELPPSPDHGSFDSRILSDSAPSVPTQYAESRAGPVSRR